MAAVSEAPLHAPTPALPSIHHGPLSAAPKDPKVVELSKQIKFELSPRAERALRLGNGEPAGPVVVVWGWVGSKHRFLEKYANLFRPHGYSIAYVACPFEYLAFMSLYNYPAFLKRFKPLADYLVDNFPRLFEGGAGGREDHVVHLAFSNGGCVNMYLFFQSLAKFHSQSKLTNAAVLLDSCPSEASPWPFANFLATMFFPKHATNPLVLALTFTSAVTFLVGIAIVRFVGRTFLRRPIGSQHAAFPLEAAAGVLHPALGSAPRLFVYSDKGDTMIDSGFVRSFAARVKRERPAAGVKLLEFPRSDHVRHLPEHPKEYEAGVEEFMRGVAFGGEDVCGWGDDVEGETGLLREPKTKDN
ncbi:hypothetical protein DFJ74DRAFT_767762 [Hyaloraphidium curvatum]|nr:hypothetical protein DFJ74DRAFT_767762 [Hyaloraphidium curvatum]